MTAAKKARAFLRGMGRALDFGGSVWIAVNAGQSDRDAIAEDWRAVADIGIELNPNYAKIAHDRLRHEAQYARMF